MSHLRPCSGCERHVRADVSRCPFCDATLATDAVAPAVPAVRLGRAAQMAFGAAAVAASLSVAACTKNPAGDDSSNIAQPYGAPPDPLPKLDAATTAEAAVAVDVDASTNIAQPYGAPPDRSPLLDALGHDAGKPDAGQPKPPPTATATALPRDWGNHNKPYGAPPADGLGEIV